MKILSFDQAVRTTGWALGIDDAIARYGVLKRTAKSVLSASERLLPPEVWMRYEIIKLVRSCAPDVVTFEGVHLGENVDTLIALASFRGACMANVYDLGLKTLSISSYELTEYLHLRVGATRDTKKARSQFIATADVFGSVIASDANQALLDDNISDAVNMLRIAQARIKVGQWEAAAENAPALSNARKSYRGANRRVRAQTR